MINEVFVIMQICDSVDNNVGCLSLPHCNKYDQTCQWYLIFLDIDTFYGDDDIKSNISLFYLI